MLNLHATVHNDQETGLPGPEGLFFVDDAELEPEGLGAHRDRLIDDFPGISAEAVARALLWDTPPAAMAEQLETESVARNALAHMRRSQAEWRQRSAAYPPTANRSAASTAIAEARAALNPLPETA